MATSTLGTNATTSLVALPFNAGVVTAQTNTSYADADFASINALIKDDFTGLAVNYAFSKEGMLFIPRRGYIKILPGDYVAVDSATGWPILLSNKAATSGPYTHT